MLGQGLSELEHWVASQGQPAFRGRQLHDWIYRHGARSLAVISVLPEAWRRELCHLPVSAPGGAPSPRRTVRSSEPAPPQQADASPSSLFLAEPPDPQVAPAPDAARAGVVGVAQSAPRPRLEVGSESGRALIGRSRLLHRSDARDGTTKLLLATEDGLSLETVGIPTADRLTVCVSSQVGCPMACRFCATGKGGLQRSLAVHEIVDQVLSVREAMGRRPTHVVFMGMGEPLLNSEAVLAAIDCLCRDLGMAQRQITVSTVGVPATLAGLAERALARLGRAQFTLAVSLHAPDQRLREELIPTARAYPLTSLLEDCRRYVAITGRRVSFEYILLGGVNDQSHHAEALAALLRGFQSHVNLIAYNPIDEEDFRRPSPQTVDSFRSTLQRRHVAVSVRASRGLDQDAACGQLRRRLQDGVASARFPLSG